eukprot:2415683-Rhodomonas_salina.2
MAGGAGKMLAKQLQRAGTVCSLCAYYALACVRESVWVCGGGEGMMYERVCGGGEGMMYGEVTSDVHHTTLLHRTHHSSPLSTYALPSEERYGATRSVGGG